MVEEVEVLDCVEELDEVEVEVLEVEVNVLDEVVVLDSVEELDEVEVVLLDSVLDEVDVVELD